MTRPSDITRERIPKAAERLFADRGYEETSVRAIVAKARMNQASINYHFGGKDGLGGAPAPAPLTPLVCGTLGEWPAGTTALPLPQRSPVIDRIIEASSVVRRKHRQQGADDAYVVD